jgi:ankyrin repeat protein
MRFYNPIVEWFLNECNADTNLTSIERGYTPLMIAANAGNAIAAHMLLSHGADVNIRDNTGLTALDYAVRSLHPEIAAMIHQYLPRPSSVKEDKIKS